MTTGRRDGRALNGSDARAVLRLAFDWIARSGPSADPSELERAMREAGYEPPPPPTPRPQQWNRTQHEGLAPLTRRLAEMLELRAHGWTADRIGREYGLAGKTVTTYLRDARRLLGAETLEQAAAEAARRGLINLSEPPPAPGGRPGYPDERRP